MFALFSLLPGFVQFGTPSLADNDGFYHLRMGALMRQSGLRIPFIWLPQSILRPEACYDQAMLIAAKFASIFMPAAA